MAKAFNTNDYRCFGSGSLRVALVTGHIPVSKNFIHDHKGAHPA
ncbi:MAG: hypothetical protein IPP46_19625 [Bacteroidetes bacterium]|nr:hypothetical protein [Bacteroidota bacterium]